MPAYIECRLENSQCADQYRGNSSFFLVQLDTSWYEYQRHRTYPKLEIVPSITK